MKKYTGYDNLIDIFTKIKTWVLSVLPTSLPANGGNSSTVNGHTVNADVPADAKFTDTNTWRPLGTGANDACAGNDSRLSNARVANGGNADTVDSYHANHFVQIGDANANTYTNINTFWSTYVAPYQNGLNVVVGRGKFQMTNCNVGWARWYASSQNAWDGTQYDLTGSLILDVGDGKLYTYKVTGKNKSLAINASDTLSTNTWRGVQNNLTSTSTTDSLSAYQGKLLNDAIGAKCAVYSNSKTIGASGGWQNGASVTIPKGTYLIFRTAMSPSTNIFVGNGYSAGNYSSAGGNNLVGLHVEVNTWNAQVAPVCYVYNASANTQTSICCIKLA